LLTAQEAAVLKACESGHTAIDIAQSLIADPSLGLLDQQQVFLIIKDLASRAFVDWTLEVPWVSDDRFEWCLENQLRKLLEGIGDKNIRHRAIEILTRFETTRDDIAKAAGNASDLDAAIHELETLFTEFTGLVPSRSGGKMYAGRTLVYEDCLRDIDVEIGHEIICEIAKPLDLILTSARWFLCEITRLCCEAFDNVYDELVVTEHTSVIPFVAFWPHAQAIIFGEKINIFDSVLRDLQQRWVQILSLSSEESQSAYSSDELQEAVIAAFPGEGRRWPYARYSSPDLMIAANGLAALRNNDYQAVLGEFHIATNTLNKMVFVAQCPSPEELFRAFESDLPEPLIIPMAPKFLITQRTYAVFRSPKDFRLTFTRDSAGNHSANSLSVGSLVIERVGGKLIVRTRDGNSKFGILEAFGDVLSERVANSFRILRASEHTPRITIDRLVVSRESWSFEAREMEFAFEKSESQRYLQARRWARREGLPRRVFYKTEEEMKPCYLDLESPILINVMTRQVRRSAERKKEGRVAVSEMLPGPEEVWLEDGEGKRYTCELRMVAVDKARRKE